MEDYVQIPPAIRSKKAPSGAMPPKASGAPSGAAPSGATPPKASGAPSGAMPPKASSPREDPDMARARQQIETGESTIPWMTIIIAVVVILLILTVIWLVLRSQKTEDTEVANAIYPSTSKHAAASLPTKEELLSEMQIDSDDDKPVVAKPPPAVVEPLATPDAATPDAATPDAATPDAATPDAAITSSSIEQAETSDGAAAANGAAEQAPKSTTHAPERLSTEDQHLVNFFYDKVSRAAEDSD
jgi:cytoskeletal protein RodZ